MASTKKHTYVCDMCTVYQQNYISNNGDKKKTLDPGYVSSICIYKKRHLIKWQENQMHNVMVGLF